MAVHAHLAEAHFDLLLYHLQGEHGFGVEA